jgi:ferredoxin
VAERICAPRKRTHRWTVARKSVQTLAFFAFLALSVAAHGARWSAWLTQLPIRLNPLTGLLSMLASRRLIAGTLVALFTVVLTVVLGRVWCGWLCPLGSLLDEWVRSPLSTFDAILRPAVLPQTPLAARGVGLFGGVLLGILAANLIAERFWCRYLCPLGGMLGLISKLALVRRSVSPQCVSCERCARTCPMGTVDAEAGYASDPGECTLCMNCVEDCALGATTFSPKIGWEGWASYDPGRREVLASIGVTLAGLGLLRSGLISSGENLRLIRPPGVEEAELLARCIRCGACVRACPTGTLQPALAEAGVDGLWTPMLVPRLGFCDYGCTVCGSSCPVGAIPQLSLPEKRAQVLGHAHLDQERCIAWAEDGACIVCEEMCPVPLKAITLEEVEIVGTEGVAMQILRPHVVQDLCIGCGVCEYQCPVEGEAAIQVTTAGAGVAGKGVAMFPTRVAFETRHGARRAS